MKTAQEHEQAAREAREQAGQPSSFYSQEAKDKIFQMDFRP
jgi:hypothetical protein